VAEQTTSTGKAACGCGLQIKHASAAGGHDQTNTGIQMDLDGKICKRNEENMREIRKNDIRES
jgi:hypothetical protein